MILAGAGVTATHWAEQALWILILCAIAFFLFIGWLHKWDNDREKRQRKKPHNARYDGGKRKR